jgi:hypothetical protein
MSCVDWGVSTPAGVFVSSPRAATVHKSIIAVTQPIQVVFISESPKQDVVRSPSDDAEPGEPVED